MGFKSLWIIAGIFFITTSGYSQNDAQIKLDNLKYYLSVIKEYSQSMRQFTDSVRIIQLLDQMDDVTYNLENEVNNIVIPEVQEGDSIIVNQDTEQGINLENEEKTMGDLSDYEKNNETEESSISKMLPFKNIIKTSIKFQLGFNSFIRSGETAQDILSPEINTGGSWFWDISLIKKANLSGAKKNVLILNYGIGYLKNRFKIENDLRLISNQQNKPEFVSIPAAKDHPSIGIGHIYMPLFLTLNLSKKVKLEAGGYLGYRVSGSQKVSLKENKEIIYEHRKSAYNLNNWMYGTQFSLNVSGYDIIFRYNISKVFKDSTVHDLNTWMLGTSFSLF